MADASVRLQRVLAVGERLERVRLEGSCACRPPTDCIEPPAPAPTAGGWEIVHDLAKDSVETTADFKEKEIKYEQQKLQKLQTMFDNAPGSEQVITDAWTRLSLGLPTMAEIARLKGSKRAKWYQELPPKYSRFLKLQQCEVGGGASAPKYYCDLLNLWGYGKPAVFDKKKVDRKTYVEKVTQKWIAAQNEMNKSGKTRADATVAWISWMGEELKFKDHLFMSERMSRESDAELARAWGSLDGAKEPSEPSEAPSDLTVIVALSLLEMARERMQIYANMVLKIYTVLKEDIEANPDLSTKQDAPELRLREAKEQQILSAREQYARAWAVHTLTVPELLLLAQRMCCASSEALKPFLLNTNEGLLVYLQKHLWTHLTDGRQMTEGAEVPPFRNLALLGGPGVGKTRTANLLATVFATSGMLLRTGERLLLDVKPGELTAEYTGQTDARIEQAMRPGAERVIFLDEAYQLGESGGDKLDNSDSLTKLVQYLSDNAGKFVFVVAGYERNMNRSFFGPNPGMKRRFDKVVKLQNIMPLDLAAIWLNQMGDKAEHWDVVEVMAYMAALIADGKTAHNVFTEADKWRDDEEWAQDRGVLFEKQADSMQKLAKLCIDRMLLRPLGNERGVAGGAAAAAAAAAADDDDDDDDDDGDGDTKMDEGGSQQPAPRRASRLATSSKSQAASGKKAKTRGQAPKAKRRDEVVGLQDAQRGSAVQIQRERPDVTTLYGVEDMRDVFMRMILDGRAVASSSAAYPAMNSVLPRPNEPPAFKQRNSIYPEHFAALVETFRAALLLAQREAEEAAEQAEVAQEQARAQAGAATVLSCKDVPSWADASGGDDGDDGDDGFQSYPREWDEDLKWNKADPADKAARQVKRLQDEKEALEKKLTDAQRTQNAQKDVARRKASVEAREAARAQQLAGGRSGGRRGTGRASASTSQESEDDDESAYDSEEEEGSD